MVVGVLISFHCFSQQDTGMRYPDHTLTPAAPATEEIFYKGSVQIGGGVVYALTNKALRQSLGGDYAGHVSGNFVVAQHIFVGGEAEWAQFGNTEIGASVNTIMIVYNAGIKVGYYTYMQNDFLFCYSLSAGPSLIHYNNAYTPAPKGGFNEKSFFLTPNVLAGYRVNNELRIGLEVTYEFLGYKFDPALTGLDQKIFGYNTSWANAPTMYIEWGFGLYWAFDEGKRK